jgi:heterodisulfide reductase subunit C
MYSVSLYAALAVFGIGLLIKIGTWFTRDIGIWAKDHQTTERIVEAIKGILGVLFSPGVFLLLKALFLDVIFQQRILKENFLRWIMHMMIYGGFMLLLIFHALGPIVVEPLFGTYYSTINPYFFFRSLFGSMVVAGLGISIYRRYIKKVPRLKTSGMDCYAIVIIAIIMVSGVLLEGLKISSYTEYQAMVEDYAGIDDEEEIEALESVWVKKFGLVSPNVEGPFDEDIIEQGWEIHENSCAECHVSTKWAFTGYAVAKISRPIAISLDEADAVNILWHIHFLACFLGLAYLPFSKMFHIFATSVSLMTNAVMDEKTSKPVNIVTRQAMELDACTHCGTCSLHCSAMMAYYTTGNDFVLPSEKMIFLKRLASGKALAADETAAVQEGIYLCTNCDRCTVVCPSGIRLKDLWISVREDLIQGQIPEPLLLSPFSFARGLNRDRLGTNNYSKPLIEIQKTVAGDFETWADTDRTLSLSHESSAHGIVNRTFSYCFGCQNCTTVCPVVGNYGNPQEILGLLPHQIMCALGWGLDEMASGAKMIWDCTTCYQCQEHCPQKVNVTELLYELKNKAVNNLKKELTS